MNIPVHANPEVTKIMQSKHTYWLWEEGKLSKEIQKINANLEYTIDDISPNGTPKRSDYLWRDIQKKCIDIFWNVHHAVIVRQGDKLVFIYAGAISNIVERVLASQLH